MATFNVKSTIITNRDATPKVLIDNYVAAGEKRSCTGYVQTNGAADGVHSLYRMCQVPSNARVDKIMFQADALATGCTMDVGVYWPTFIPVGAGLSASAAATVINTTLFASAIACSAANALTEITNQSTNNTIVKQEQCLWQAAGLASDPGIDLDIVCHVAGAVAAQGYIGLKVDYVE